jgi:hypothetical protein
MPTPGHRSDRDRIEGMEERKEPDELRAIARSIPIGFVT